MDGSTLTGDCDVYSDQEIVDYVLNRHTDSNVDLKTNISKKIVITECTSTGKNQWEQQSHPYICGWFVLCMNDIGIESQCPENLLFNPDIGLCDLSENVNCDDITTTTAPEDPTTDTTLIETTETTASDDFTTDTSVETTTENVTTVETTTENDTTIDNTTKDDPTVDTTTEDYTTIDTTTEDATTVVTTTENDTTVDTTTEDGVITTTENDTTVETTTNDDTTVEITTKDDTTVITTTENDTTVDTTTENNTTVETTTNDDTTTDNTTDDDTTATTDQEETTTDSNLSPETTTDQLETTSIDNEVTTEEINTTVEDETTEGATESDCEPLCADLLASGGEIADPSNCGRFISCTDQCSGGTMFCPSNLHFNHIMSVCDLPERAECLLEVCVGIPTGVIPSVNSCRHYYGCMNSNAILQSCGPGLVFDPVKKLCVTEDADNPCVFPDIPAPPPEVYSQCTPTVVEQQLRHPTRCDVFYRCVRGMLSGRICLDGLLFDESLGKCNLAELVDCVDETEQQ
ncbi:uncharacterized protein LOC135710398 [Ochlerotatus camptorhynchus]|uniref:uncharacterized protein LOC135710398 n=1 Tax=Ochlerotatus camptorhynchus TaxID=644619 RepID=UPI0031D0C1CB